MAMFTTTDMRDVLNAHRCADLHTALAQDLPFKIPITNDQIAQQFPTIFEYDSSNISCYVGSFLHYTDMGNYQVSAFRYDGDWLRAIDGCLQRVNFISNQYDSSSNNKRLYEITIQVCGAVVLRQEATHNSKDVDNACHELAQRLPIDAMKVFPKGSNSIVGIASCVGKIQISIITFDPITHTYSSQVYKEYKVNEFEERVRFLATLMKVCRWMASVTESNSFFHLVPDVRYLTNNNHSITWTVEGIHKEFDRRRDMRQALQYMHQVYTHHPSLLHVEYGRVIDNKSVMITRLGNKLLHSTMRRLCLDKEKVIAQVRLGLDELHSIGLAHCDVSPANVFIDDDCVVFLVDLEYLTPINDPAPHFTRLPYGVTNDQVESAEHLDELQFSVFRTHLYQL